MDLLEKYDLTYEEMKSRSTIYNMAVFNLQGRNDGGKEAST
jgi:hypothetical protein